MHIIRVDFAFPLLFVFYAYFLNILIAPHFENQKKKKQLMFQFVFSRLPSQVVIHLENAWANRNLIMATAAAAID